jgi:outer membrane protein assembly factor BamB
MSKPASRLLPPLCLVLAAASCPPPDSDQTPYYAQTSWAGVHGDARNSDHAPLVTPTECAVAWTALDGAATLLAPTFGPEGHLYVTTGRGPGTSHLHCFDREGRLLWESPRCFSNADLDSWAVLSAPVVDCDGDVYVSDSNQLWAFRANGGIHWAASLAALGASNGFVSCVITAEGLVGGVTTDGLVLLFERASGRLARPVLSLPGGAGPPGPLSPPWGLWGGDLIDPARVAAVFYPFFGFRAEVANTPAVHPVTGRLYVVAAGATPDAGTLYGIDVGPQTLSIAFATPMGGGSGTSPALSPDGTRVYAADGDGVMHAFDAASGALLWSVSGLGAAASPGVGPDGTVYAGSGAGQGGVLTALDPGGHERWSASYDDLANDMLAPLPPMPPIFPTGLPTAKVNSVVTTSAHDVWAALALGYDVVAVDGSPAHQPRLTVLARIDPATGSILGLVPLRDTCEGVISIGPDGSLYVSHAAIQSSVFWYFTNLLLPPAYDAPGPPRAGLTAVRATSPLDLAAQGIAWARDLGLGALTGLSAGDPGGARDAARRAAFQCAGTLLNVAGVAQEVELSASAASTLRGHVDGARTLFHEASQLLADPGAGTQAGARVASALSRLADAGALLDAR